MLVVVAGAAASAGAGDAVSAPGPPVDAADSGAALSSVAAVEARERRDGLDPLVSGPASPLLPAADPEVTPVASRIWSMMSAFFVRLFVLSDMAWAMALSSSRSLPSRTDRSSCCSAVIGLLIYEGCRQARGSSARGEEN